MDTDVFFVTASNSTTRIDTGDIPLNTSCEYKISLVSSLISSNLSTGGTNPEEFNLRIQSRYVVDSIIGLYSYNFTSKKFILLNETSELTGVLNVRFTNSYTIYINYYSRSNTSCAGLNLNVSGPGIGIEYVPQPQPQPQPEPESEPEPQSDPYTAQTQSAGDSKTLSAGAIVGIVLSGVFLVTVIVLIILFRENIMNLLRRIFAESDKIRPSVQINGFSTKKKTQSIKKQNTYDTTTNETESRDKFTL